MQTRMFVAGPAEAAPNSFSTFFRWHRMWSQSHATVYLTNIKGCRQQRRAFIRRTKEPLALLGAVDELWSLETMPSVFRLIILCLLALMACGKNRAPKSSVHEVNGSVVTRAATISAIIAKHKAPPTIIRDAQFVEERTGDGVLGPSDFRAFCLVEVAPQDVSRWTQILSPLEMTAEFAAPIQPRDWWIARDAFAALQFYKPNILTGRIHGWIGVSKQTGRIYIFTFTM